MPNSIGPTGLTTATYAELIAQYTAAFQAIYGADIVLTSDSPDGQLMNEFVQSVIDLEDLLTQIYNMFDPDNAVGAVLDQRVAINGIQRQGGTFTVTNVTIVTSQALNLYGLDQSLQAVFTVADNAGNNWQLITSQSVVAAGTYVFAFEAEDPGATLTVPNTITVPVTIVLGVSSINNPTTYSTLGINEESDAALKIRRQLSVSLSSQGYLAGLLAALKNINGITSAFVYENVTDSVNSDGVPGHSIWVIVAGTPSVPLANAYSSLTTYQYGNLASSGGINYISVSNSNTGNALSNPVFWEVYNPVAQAIYTKRNAGAGMFGATSYTVIQIDGSSFVVRWDVVTAQNLFMTFTASSIDGVNPPNIAGILAGLPVSFVPGVNAEVNINALATLVQAIDPNTLVTSAGFSRAQTQTLTLSGVAASGTFEFSYNGNASAAVNWNDAIGTIQTKLQAVTGLAAATITGSIASQSLVINLTLLSNVAALVTTVANSLQTGGATPITFSYNEGYANTLSPSAKNRQFVVAGANIVITPMILSPVTSVVVHATTKQFTGLGGYGTLAYSISANNSGASINSSTGLYTAGATPNVMDTVKVTDALGNTATATVTVS